MDSEFELKYYTPYYSIIHSQVILASHEDRYEAQHQAVDVITTLNEYDENWIADQTDLIAALKSIWNTDLYKVISCNCIHFNSIQFIIFIT